MKEDAIALAESRSTTKGLSKEVRDHVLDVHEKTRYMPGFVMSICGGIHGNIPLENLEAYFDTRVEIGYTMDGWRKK